MGAAHLGAVWALAFLQPMLSLLGENPEFFVARGNTTGQIVVYALALALVPPLIGLLLEYLARLISDDLRWGLHLLLMTLVGAAFFLQLIEDHLDWPAGLLIGFSVLLAAAAVFAYSRWRFPRTFMDILTPAPIVILLIFFLFSGTSRLILPREQPDPVDVTVGNPAPVVMVLFDEFPVAALMTPQGKVDRSRFPAFADLASSSTWYRNATADAAYTPLAVPAILSGREPSRSDLPIAADYPKSIFTLLGKQYRLNVMETATKVCPEELCPDPAADAGDEATLGQLFSDLEVVQKHLLLPESMRRNLPDISTNFSNFTNESDPEDAGVVADPGYTGTTGPTGATGETTPVRTGQGAARRLGRLFAESSTADEFDRVKQFTDSLEPGQRKTLDLIHVEKPHYPWRHIPDGQRYTNLTSEWSGLLPNDGPWLAPPHIVDIALQRHLLEVGYTDTLLGLITSRLKKTGLWDRAMVVVAADHGAGFLSKVPRRAADPRNIGEIGSIPLFIKRPGQTTPDVVDRHVCATDVLPAVADGLEIDYPWEEAACPEDQVKVLNSPDGEASVSLETTLEQRQALIDRIERVFGTGQGWGPAYRFGPQNQLIGNKVSRLDADRRLGKYRVLPERRNAVKNYDPSAPALLGLLQRGLLKRFGEDRVLAVAVDDRIVATGWTFKDGLGAGPGYSILLPPDSLKPGFNRVDIYLVEDDGKRLQMVYSGAGPLPGNASGPGADQGATGNGP